MLKQEKSKLSLINYLNDNNIQYEAQTTYDRLFTSKEYVEWLDCAMGAKLTVDSGLTEDISKIVIRQVFNTLPITQIYEQLIKEDAFDSLKFILCNESIIEIVNNGVDKQSQIDQLSSGQNTYAIGDSENDIQMLNSATRGYLISSENKSILEKLNDNVVVVDNVAHAIKMILKEFYE